jgi:predicted DsbA family dithiol-disulfide isomerase
VKTVHIDVWSDFVCPWCWIAKARLDQAIQRMNGQLRVSITSHAYRLAKGMAPMDFSAALTMKFGSERQAQQMMAAVASHGATEGLTYNFHSMRFGDTRAAHALVKSLGTEDERQKMIEALSMASITHGQNIFDRAILGRIAMQAGMSADQVATVDFDRTSDIEQDERRASEIANGVPLFLFNSTSYISGAQSVDTFVAALSQSAREQTQALRTADGPQCGI